MSEVRLIDANALKENLRQYFTKGEALYQILTIIDNAPTVTNGTYEQGFRVGAYGRLDEIRPKGEWEKCQNAMFRCSNCRQADEVPTAMGTPIYDFCPNCGAKMKKGGAE